MGGSGGSIVVAFIRRQVLPAADTETAPSLLWVATIQCIESKQDLAGLAPKDCFIPAKPVERVAGQIGQTQKATCEVGGGINGFRPRAGPGFRSVCDALRCSIGVGVAIKNPRHFDRGETLKKFVELLHGQTRLSDNRSKRSRL